jgi:hypothetical protein
MKTALHVIRAVSDHRLYRVHHYLGHRGVYAQVSTKPSLPLSLPLTPPPPLPLSPFESPKAVLEKEMGRMDISSTEINLHYLHYLVLRLTHHRTSTCLLHV